MATRNYDAIMRHIETGYYFEYPNAKWVHSDIKETYADGERVTNTIKIRRKPRSLSQNGLFHAYCGIIAEETGNSLERVKSTLKGLYAKRPFKYKDDNDVINEQTGEVLTYIQDTSDMSTVEFGALIDKTRMFAAEWFQINLPLPEEQIPFNFNKK